MRIVVTGGHHTAALPVIEQLKELDSSVEVFWIGHKYSLRGDQNVSAEYRDILALGVPFYDIAAQKVYGVNNPFRLFRVLRGFFNAFMLLGKIRPDGIISFGGYIAVPVVISGWIKGIPSVTHEQTIVTGYANKLVSIFVSKVFVSWKESESHFPKNKVLFTGLPIRRVVFKPSSNYFHFDRQLPTIYITGGKQGSHRLNVLVKDCLENLLKMANVIHSCGSYSGFNDELVLKAAREGLPVDLKPSYHIINYVTEDIIGEVFDKASLVVSRAGANIVLELISLHKPALLIPIKRVSHDEQERNAKAFVECGLGISLDEDRLTGDLLVKTVSEMLSNIGSYKLRATQDDRHGQQAAKTVAYEAYKIFSR